MTPMTLFLQIGELPVYLNPNWLVAVIGAVIVVRCVWIILDLISGRRG